MRFALQSVRVLWPALRPALQLALQPGWLRALSLASRRAHPAAGRRAFGSGTGVLPRGLLFRVFWTGTTALTGYLYYQVSQASSWASHAAGQLADLGLDALWGGLAAWTRLSTAATAAAESHQGWNPLGWTRRTPAAKGPAPRASAGTAPADAPADDAPHTGERGHDEQHFGHFTRKMIEVRNILKTADMHGRFTLPSIVVVGAQSSGKSSVLESIVGHDFLPKGPNMVTRRPLELTLVNAPGCARDYAVFAHLETGPIYDFAQVQRTLTEMNLAVGDSQWVSPKPIELAIYSRAVPDLTLVDLPGYIQVNSRNQPPVLREKIAQLCEKYIREDNIILAVCPADVDLANAEALKASRRFDPAGHRTIGVITKLDLVDPEYSARLIRNEDYPLKLGYIGVVCRPAPADAGAGVGGALSPSHAQGSSARYEEEYLGAHRSVFEQVRGRVGVGSLCRRLSETLEESMRGSLSLLLSNVQAELAELAYSLKVEYSDRVISPEGYVSFLAASIRSGLESVARDYSRSRVREHLRTVLHGRLLSVAERVFWEQPAGAASDERHLHQAVAMLTRSGVGRIAANSLVDTIISQVKQVIKDGPLSHHPAAKERLLRQVEAAMRARCQTAIEQVENAIKPLKHELEYTEQEWARARTRTVRLLRETVASLERDLKLIHAQVGSKRLRRTVEQLRDLGADGEAAAGGRSPSSEGLERRAKEAVLLNRRLQHAQKRLGLIEGAGCAELEKPASGFWSLLGLVSRAPPGEQARRNQSATVDAGTPEAHTIHVWNNCQARCPEVYLYLVMENLLAASALYVHHELVHEFLHPFPDEVASSIPPTDTSQAGSVMGLDRREILEFVQENPAVARHLHLQERRRVLERAKDRLLYLQHLKTPTQAQPDG